MKNVKKSHVVQVAALSAFLFLGAVAIGRTDETPASPSTQADNTRMNQRDRDRSEPTADQATNAQPDREIMRQIRRSVVADKSLSTAAHNVKIIAKNGQVTLKGPVNTAEEKTKIEQVATQFAGAGKVTNEISIKTASN